ncbi:MAG: hypothetical protein ACE5FP_08135, partial [Gemmatimonadota bacterium]
MDNGSAANELSVARIRALSGGRLNPTLLLYNIGWRLSGPLLAVAGLFSPKLARAVAGRREAVTRFRTWA